MRLAALLLLITSSAVSAGCQTPRTSMQPVPIPPPDTVPRSIYEPSNMTTSSWITGTFVSGVLEVRFKAGSSAAARSALLQQVAGQVIGGRRDRGNDGLYYVRISPDRDFHATYQELQRSQLVEFVSVLLVDAIQPQ
jgi:hypothetical protein